MFRTPAEVRPPAGSNKPPKDKRFNRWPLSRPCRCFGRVGLFGGYIAANVAGTACSALRIHILGEKQPWPSAVSLEERLKKALVLMRRFPSMARPNLRRTSMWAIGTTTMTVRSSGCCPNPCKQPLRGALKEHRTASWLNYAPRRWFLGIESRLFAGAFGSRGVHMSPPISGP